MSDLSSQLTDIFKAGLDSNPDLAKALANAVNSDYGTGGQSQTKAEANYRQSDGGKESCDSCKHFDGTSACDIVSGHISPNGVSDNYEPAESSSDSSSTSSGSSGSSDSSSSSSQTSSSDKQSQDYGSTGKDSSNSN